MSDEIFVEPSAEQGNVPLEEELPAPSEQPIEPETPAAEKVETVKPAEPQLFPTPDGRMVDGQTLAREWKENFLPEFTRKSQALAEMEKAQNKPKETIENPYAKADYVPQNYEEIISVAEQRALDRIKSEQKAYYDQQVALETDISNQLTELKGIDPNLNENSLFAHANDYRTKYGVSFPDLKSAYIHMKDVAELTKSVQQTTAKNMQKHADPVSTTQGRASGNLPNPSNYSSARDYLKAVQG